MDDKDEHIRQLEQRIEQLEATIKKMLPSRREALRLGGAAVIGGAAMTGSASAGTSSTGTITGPVDIEAEDITQLDTINGDNLVTTSESTDYEVQKDGSDSTGVINFKTS
jgi:hypothetical protein